jgi:hypothetical protein
VAFGAAHWGRCKLNPGPLPPRLVTKNLKDLYHEQLPPPTEVIEGFLYHGLTLCAGPPKVGKSFLACQFGDSGAR